MKKTILFFFLLLSINLVSAQADLNYYLPDISYNKSIPTPESVLGFQIGEWHVSHDQLAKYMEVLAASSPRASLQEYGRSHERRPLYHLVITSEENQKNLETLRENHLALTDPSRSAGIDISDMPAVVLMGYGVHGNEASSHNAAPLVAWYFLAAQGNDIEEILKNTIIIIDPSLNPDGQNRYASWVNRNRSHNLVSDPNNREFNEVWPGSRTNHYWFDLNRDWLPLQHPESRARVAAFHQWKPNINTDHHEFGSGATFFFQPGIPSRTNPLTPERTIHLTRQIGEFHARAFDQIGSLYFTEETFDDFYYGKGSTYPDANGSVGILFEQAGLRGHLRETNHGILDFAFTIKNQVVVSLSTVESAQHLRLELLEHLRWFYTSALKEAAKEPVKAWVFGDNKDSNKNTLFKKILKSHQIDMYELAQPVQLEGISFKPGKAWVVPADQPEYRLIQAIFSQTKEFEDSLFYDISSWTMPLAFNLPYAGASSKEARDLSGSKVQEVSTPQGHIYGQPEAYAWVFEWTDLYAPKALYQLQQKGVRAKVATMPLHIEVDGQIREFSNGSVMIPVQHQEMTPRELYELLTQVAAQSGIEIYEVPGGLTRHGVDLGSGTFSTLRKPEIMLLVGDGVQSTEAGEVWNLLDNHYHIPVTHVELDRLNNIDLGRYNTIVMVSGRYNSISESTTQKLRSWVRNGGIIVGIKGATRWLSDQGLANITYREVPEQQDPIALPYASRRTHLGARNIPGSIFLADLDLTHPLGYGYQRQQVPVHVSGLSFAEPAKNPFANPLMFRQQSLTSGYVFGPYETLPDGSTAVVVNSSGRGAVISFLHNPNFRGFWFGTSTMFMNAVFFGNIISN